MLTANIDVKDKLNNGQIGTVYHIAVDRFGNVTKIYVKMDDNTAGKNIIRTDPYSTQHDVVPIERVENVSLVLRLFQYISDIRPVWSRLHSVTHPVRELV